jgi:hypothetical protein
MQFKGEPAQQMQSQLERTSALFAKGTKPKTRAQH